jgi:hypothetical protein
VKHLSGAPSYGRLMALPTNIRLGWKVLTGINAPAYWVLSEVKKKRKYFEKGPGFVFTTLKLKYGPNKIKCYALAILSSQVFGNTLAYRTIRKLQRK